MPNNQSKDSVWALLYRKLLGNPQQEGQSQQQDEAVKVEEDPSTQDKRLEFQQAFRKKTGY